MTNATVSGPTALPDFLGLALGVAGDGVVGDAAPGAAAEAAGSVAGFWSVIDAIVFGEVPKLRFKPQQKRRGSLHLQASRFVPSGPPRRHLPLVADGWPAKDVSRCSGRLATSAADHAVAAGPAPRRFLLRW